MILVDKQCPMCKIIYFDLDRDNENKCCCGAELEVLISPPNVSKDFRPSAAKKAHHKRPKIDKDGKIKPREEN